ncbi:sigma-70 family RNA polymerase sigma factor [Pyxidicoccus parkwayensis]|uniref:Sigma-70 family RNA polymerase sigma factor n=1 Tax=Pyxidicoccus parkwayensis TaxID=2813578 RepID=A0ABX7NRL7_9BACT|nr:sigma-70 family RNA polymerase sigma factor [Pyxidicoccus parkwaysis]QSQ21524.1 sigma-70 family RNA polymerase sigma factor [Pyxidicoccus parkwaysis]
MDAKPWLTQRFEESREHLRAVAFRMLGSRSDAEDAVQEVWLRLTRADTSGVENLGGWMTTVVARVCLDMLRARKARPEEPQGAHLPDTVVKQAGAVDPEKERLLADSIGPALLVVLDTLGPAERLAFVLHDMFAVSFDEIATIVGRTPTAARQLASRARRRIQGGAVTPEEDLARQRTIVEAFLAASREGNFDALLSLLDPEVVVRADSVAVRKGAFTDVRGAQAVASTFKGRAQGAQLALVNGAAGAVWIHGGQPRLAFNFVVEGGRIMEIELIADPTSLDELSLEVLGGTPSP